MKSEKTKKSKSTVDEKADVVKVSNIVAPAKKSRKSDKKEPEAKTGTNKIRKKTVVEEPVKPKASESKKIVKKEQNKSEQKKPVRRKKVAEPTIVDMTMSVTVPDAVKVEQLDQKSKSKNIVKKKPRNAADKKGKKSSKKDKILLDNEKKNGIIDPVPKVGKVSRKRSNVETQVVDDDDFEEGKSKKRKRGSGVKKISDYKVEYQFRDSIDDPEGDARSDFNSRSTDGEPDYIWCQKRECRIYRNICGMYVKPACHKKTRCIYYDHGMTVKNKYNLKTLEDPKKESKKKGGDNEEYGGGGGEDDNSNDLD